MEYGLDVQPTEEELQIVNELAHSFAADPGEFEKVVTPHRQSDLTPATTLLIRELLDQFGQNVITSALSIRNYVTNRLMIESDNPDPRIRLRALEKLGTISDVALFTERVEQTVTHQTTDDLRNKLREKFNTIKELRSAGADSAFSEKEDVIDVEAELGFDK